jgi:hypothetical protein
MLVIVPCGGAYVSTFFRANRRYAETFGDGWVILSAKYGFVRPETLIPGPYNLTFNRRATGPIGLDLVTTQAETFGLGSAGQVVVLGGRHYREVAQIVFTPLGCDLQFPFAACRGLGYMIQATQRAVASGQPFPTP